MSASVQSFHQAHAPERGIFRTALVYLSELARFRALIAALVIRHLSVRYRGSTLGFLWSFLNPLLLMLVYTLIFHYYVRVSNVEHYNVFVFVGLLPWLWISTSLIEGTQAIVSSGHLLTKSMFPAHILPFVANVQGLVHFILSLPLLFIFMLIVGQPFHWTLLLLPGVFLLQFLFTQGLLLGLSALNVFFRDVQHITGHMLTFLFFLCPILYPVSTVPERFRFTLDYNPFALIISFYHLIILDGSIPPLTQVLTLLAATCIVLLVGVAVYDHYREGFAELL